MVILLLLLLVASNCSEEISAYSLQAFFNYTYDGNHDGVAKIDEFVKYFRFMEPEHNVTEESISNIFQFFDQNHDSQVTLEEMIKFGGIKASYKPGHKQIHIGFTERPNEMQVMWVSNPERYRRPIVRYSLYPTRLRQSSQPASSSTYNVGHVGFHGAIYRAVLKDLIPGKRYYYQVGDEETQTYSEIKYFKAPPVKNAQLEEINIAIFGDMGTFAPLGNTIMRQITANNLAHPYDFVFLTGDIAYAGMNSEKVGQIEPIWDLFGQLTEKFAAYVPFMPGVGNHEKYYNYSSYFHRYRLPRSYPGQTNLWFSFDYGQIHMTHFSSEHDYRPGSEQYNFLQQDLKAASQNPATKWIILGVHRAFYSSDTVEYHEVTPLAQVLEDLVNKYHVDIVQTGHLHSYERSWPVYKGQPIKQGHTETHFVKPTAPIYVVQGTAGALINEKWIAPSPSWSLKRMLRYGYGRIRIQGNTLRYQYINAPGGKILDEWFITK